MNAREPSADGPAVNSDQRGRRRTLKALVAGLFTAAAATFAVGRLLLGRRVQRDRR